MSWRPAALCLLAACRIGFDPLASDANVDDASLDDANLDDALRVTCPPSYTVTLPSTASRYLVTTTTLLLTDHHTLCAQHLPGATHLVALDSLTELMELDAVLQLSPPPPLGRYYVGAIQRESQPAVDASWLTYTGEPVLPELWRSGEPNDLDDVEDGAESNAVVDDNGRLVDVSGTQAYGAVCECDGRAIATEVSSLLGGG